jgi:tetratricopeptide (TPR) repeat protein
MRRWVWATVLVVSASASAYAAEPVALARARALYNEGNYDAAVEAATEALKTPAVADTASLVLGRALMERYRHGAQAADLAAAREALTRVRQQTLAPRDRLDLLVGLGQLLFLGEAFGAAAELFDTALAQHGTQPSHTRSQLLDWWASALSREAQSRAADKRVPVYARIVERMENELRSDAGNAPASYWLAVGARGVGDLERAWDAAIAGWVRASLNPDTAASLRADLDRLVTQALVTERARQRQIPGRDVPETSAALLGEWDLIKTQWK